MVNLASAIRDGHRRGWAFTPLRGKVPIMKEWQRQPRCPLHEALGYASHGNVGLRTGKISGVSVIDIEAPFAKIAARFPATATVKTGSGGYHLYYQHAEGVKNLCRSLVDPDTGQQVDGVDVRGEGGQVVYVGSLHPDTGLTYRWTMRRPDTCGLAPFPVQWLPPKPQPRPMGRVAANPGDKRIKAYLDGALSGIHRDISQAVEGTRNDTLCRAAYSLGRMVGAGWIGQDEAIELAVSAALTAGLPEYEARKTTELAVGRGRREPMQLEDRPTMEQITAW